jgi:hypothetical protein
MDGRFGPCFARVVPLRKRRGTGGNLWGGEDGVVEEQERKDREGGLVRSPKTSHHAIHPCPEGFPVNLRLRRGTTLMIEWDVPIECCG